MYSKTSMELGNHELYHPHFLGYTPETSIVYIIKYPLYQLSNQPWLPYDTPSTFPPNIVSGYTPVFTITQHMQPLK